jgi:hypothetical protein
MARTLRTTLNELASTFASDVLSALRSASLQEILAETGGLRRGPGRPRSNAGVLAEAAALTGSKKRAHANTSSSNGSNARLARRSEEDIAGLVERIVALLARKPNGLRAEQIRAALHLEAKELPRPLADGLAAKRILKEGQKRATTYFARGAAKSQTNGKRPQKRAAEDPAAP